MSNQLNDSLVVFVNVLTAYYLYAFCSGLLGVFASIYSYYRQREQNKLLAEKLQAVLDNHTKRLNCLTSN